MEQENVRIEEDVVDNTDYITAIKELKENSVDKAKYDDLRLKNKQLLDALVNGQSIEQEVVKPKKDLNELRKFLTDDSLTNLDYIKSALELRNELISQGERDPFVPYGSKYVPVDEDFEAAERVAQGLQAMVDIADGNPNVFMNEYERRVVNTAPTKPKTKK